MAYEIDRRGLLAGGLLLGLAAGCGSGAASATGDAVAAPVDATGPTEADARRALQVWSAFPVGAVPRPVVLVAPPVLDPSTGFPDGATKLSYLDGAFGFPASYPGGPARAAGVPVIDARQAAAVLRAENHIRSEPPPGRLPVTGIRFGTAGFRTDRGNRSLPAWLFSLRGVRDPAAVLAVAPAARFTPRLPSGAMVDPSLGNAALSADGRTVSVGFLGAAGDTPQCAQKYVLRMVESAQAVALRIGLVPADEDERGKGGPPGACEDATYHRSANVTLAAPLGARVLISARDATPMAVSTGA